MEMVMVCVALRRRETRLDGAGLTVFPAARKYRRRPSMAVMRGLDPRIHLLRKSSLQRLMDCTATRACPSCAVLSAASRVNPTCGVKPGNDELEFVAMRFRG